MLLRRCRHRKSKDLDLFVTDVRLGTGECVRLVGPSRLGKSTLLEIAAGLTPPDAGGNPERRGGYDLPG